MKNIFEWAISGAQNIYSVVFEEKEMEDAIKDVTITTSTSTVTVYNVFVYVKIIQVNNLDYIYLVFINSK